MQGESFLPALKGEALKERQKPIFWQWAKGKAIRVGNWKAVANKEVWALYDMQNDRNETTDLKTKNPDKFQELKNLYDQWAAKNVSSSTSTDVDEEQGSKKEKKKKKQD
jgi:arylsulfatase